MDVISAPAARLAPFDPLGLGHDVVHGPCVRLDVVAPRAVVCMDPVDPRVLIFEVVPLPEQAAADDAGVPERVGDGPVCGLEKGIPHVAPRLVCRVRWMQSRAYRKDPDNQRRGKATGQRVW